MSDSLATPMHNVRAEFVLKRLKNTPFQGVICPLPEALTRLLPARSSGHIRRRRRRGPKSLAVPAQHQPGANAPPLFV